jgi:hypothetical protein
MEQGLAPGMQDGQEADLCAEMFGICGDGSQGLGCGLEEQVVAETLVLQRDG